MTIANINKTRIAILGLGGVGGYFGGLLAAKYYSSQHIEIIFITKAASEHIIKEKGLKLISPEFEKIVFPHLVSSNPKEIGYLDYLICATKTYNIEESIIQLKPCINDNTIILPLFNGVDSREKIKSIYPGSEVLEACVYIVSRQTDKAVIKKTGKIHSLYFGSVTANAETLKELEKILLGAGIECFIPENITSTIWEKFIFISSIASLTSHLNLSIGQILCNEIHRETLILLLNEIKLIADGLKIELDDSIIEKTISKMENLPFETTTSMQDDFQKGRNTELESLTGHILKLGIKLNIQTPVFRNIYQDLLTRVRPDHQ